MMTMVLNKYCVFLVSRISFPLTQEFYYFIQGDLSWRVFWSQFFPFIIEKGSHLCVGRETGTVPLSDLCPQPRLPPSSTANSRSGRSGPTWATSQPRNVSFPSSPHILPVMYATFWGGNNTLLFTTKAQLQSLCVFLISSQSLLFTTLEIYLAKG